MEVNNVVEFLHVFREAFVSLRPTLPKIRREVPGLLPILARGQFPACFTARASSVHWQVTQVSSRSPTISVYSISGRNRRKLVRGPSENRE